MPPDLSPIFQTLPGLYLIVAADPPRYTIVAASDAYCRATGITRDAVGRPAGEVFPHQPGDSATTANPAILDSYARVIATGRPDTLPTVRYDIRQPDGTVEERHWDPVNTPVLGPDGRVTHIIHRADDVTESVRRRRQAEADARAAADLRAANRTLADAEQRLRQITDSIPALVSYVDATGRHAFANAAYADWFGLPSDQVVGRTLEDVVGRAGVEARRPHIADALAGRHVRFEVAAPHRDGTTRVTDVSYVPDIADDGATVHGFYIFAFDVTARVLAQQELRDARERLGLAQQAGGVGAFDWLVAEDRVIWTPELESLYGLAPGAFEGDFADWRKRVVPEDAAAVEASIADCLRHRRDTLTYEFRAVLPGGRHRWLAGQARFFYDPAGNPARMIGVNIDVDARKRAEHAALNAERLHRAIIDAVHDAVILYTPDGVIVDVNPAACRIYGFTPDQVVGRNARDIIPPETVPLFDDFLRTTAAGREFRCDAVDHRMDGTRFPIEVVGTSFTYNDRLHLLAVIRDITDRARAIDRVRRLYGVAAALSEAVTPDDVARVTIDQGLAALGASAGSLALVSDDGRELVLAGHTGYAKDVIDPWLRFPLDAPIPITDAFRTAQPVFLLTPEERVRRYPALAAVRANPGTRSSACMPLLTGGKPVGVLALSFDRDNALTADDDRDFILSLTRQCAQALERARLFEAERAARADAERASAAKSQFLATLSHELRTPLTPVLLTVSMIESRPDLPDSLREDVATIRRNVELESRLIGDLLDLTRVARGKLQLDPHPTDAHAAIRSAIDICQREASANLSVHLDAPHHTVHADPTRLQQIFWNLINNAQKFTPPDGAITIRTRNEPPSPASPDHPALIVEISDTGAGIDPALLPKLFTAFEQGDIRSTRQHAGLGLGLAISRHLAQAHHGDLTASSPGRNQGSTFTLTLPTIPAASPLPHTPLPPSSNPQSPIRNPQSPPLSILLVEDHPPTLRILTRLLTHLGHRVTGTSTAAAATTTALQSHFDLLVCDLGLPDGSGLDVMRNLRHRYAGRAIALTGYGMDSDVAASLAAGFSLHLTKPVDLPRLQSALTSLAPTARPPQ